MHGNPDNDMKLKAGVWLPAHETHLPKWMETRNDRVDGRLTYQHHKLRAALRYVRPSRDTALDVGAHCGLWAMHLVRIFETVHAFEPVELHRRCFTRNLEDTYKGKNYVLHPYALGEAEQYVSMHTTPGSSGDTWVQPGSPGTIPMKRLDDVDLSLLDSDRVDFIKLDCEGYELFALRGGEKLLLTEKPCVIVEQKPGKAQNFGLGETDAVRYLQSLGAVLREELAGDYILSW